MRITCAQMTAQQHNLAVRLAEVRSLANLSQKELADKIPMKLVHTIAASIFAVLGLATLLGAGAKLGL